METGSLALLFPSGSATSPSGRRPGRAAARGSQHLVSCPTLLPSRPGQSGGDAGQLSCLCPFSSGHLSSPSPLLPPHLYSLSFHILDVPWSPGALVTRRRGRCCQCPWPGHSCAGSSLQLEGPPCPERAACLTQLPVPSRGHGPAHRGQAVTDGPGSLLRMEMGVQRGNGGRATGRITSPQLGT